MLKLDFGGLAYETDNYDGFVTKRRQNNNWEIISKHRDIESACIELHTLSKKNPKTLFCVSRNLKA